MKSTKILAGLVLSVIMAVFATTAVAAPIANGSTLYFDPGSGSGTNAPCTSGSCFGMYQGPGNVLWTDIAPGLDGGVVVGKDQQPGSTTGGTEMGDISDTWNFFFNYGTFATAPFCCDASGTCVTTGASGNIFDNMSCYDAADCLGQTELGSWHVSWNGVAVPMGSALGCLSTSPENCVGVSSFTWGAEPAAIGYGSTFELVYSWAVPDGDASGFGNVPFYLILRGTAYIADPCADAATRCNDNNACTNDLCDPSSGICSHTNKANGTTCNDGNGCTLSDTCTNGVCAGTLKVCNDNNPCTADSCLPATGQCRYTPLWGPACDDGNNCTLNDSCSGGICRGTANNCSDNDVCTTDSCDTATGVCTNTPGAPTCGQPGTPLPNGTRLGITQGRGSGTNVRCSVGSCFGMEVSAGLVAWTDFGPGTDGGIVVGKSQASGGQEAGPSGAINTPGELSAAWSYLNSYGTFFTSPNGDTRNIYDSNSCVGADCIYKTELKVFNLAWNGNMLPMGSQAGCTHSNCSTGQKEGIYVNSYMIDPDTGAWSMDYSQVVPSGAFTGVRFAAIMRGTVMCTDDGNPCTDDVLVNNVCIHRDNTAACNDGIACTADTCDPATGCVNTPIVICNDNNACTIDSCDPATVSCVFTPRECNDYDPCTADSCDPAAGCIHTTLPDCNAVWNITTVAGNGTMGYSGDNGPATSASLYYPEAVAVDSSGNIYIADCSSGRIRKVDTTGTITTVAGNGKSWYSGDNGPATSASLDDPYGVVVDLSGNIYIADALHDRIRKVDTSGIITTVAGNGVSGYSGDNGPAASASLYRPRGISVDSTGNLYIADTYNNCIRKVDTTGTITTVAGNGASGYSGDNGPAASASLYIPSGVTVDSSGNIYIADNGNNRIRKVDIYGTITTVAGNGASGYSGDNGQATSARINYPSSVAVDTSGNIYIADNGNHRIRKVTVSIVTCAELPDGTPCYDGNACTAGDACSGGACAGTAVNCSDNDVCTDDGCDPATGACVHTPVIGCDPNLLQAGTKLGIEQGFGSATNIPCYEGSCFSTEVAPGFVVWTDFGPGTDGGIVVGKSQASGGQETGPSEVISTRGELSDAWWFFNCFGTFYTSPDGGTQNIFNSTSCGGADCIGKTDLKVFNVAWNGNIIPMGSAGGCTLSSCTPEQMSGIFVNDYQIDPITDGAWSMDYSRVIPSGQFAGVPFGAIIRGKVTLGDTCSDGNPCTDEALIDGACVHTPNTAACNDGNACTTVDVCSNGACLPGTATNCDDGNACTIDTCDPATGCVYSPVVCQDNNACTSDTCDPAMGCVHTNNTLPCNDNNACTTGDVCSGGVCVSGSPVVCNDGNVCTDDACVAGSCVYSNNTASCNDNNACTTDTCDPIAGCVHATITNCDAVGIITTVAGNGTIGYSGDNGSATSAELNNPYGVAVDSSGNIYIAEYTNNRIRRVDIAGTITTVAGNGTSGYSGDNGPATAASLNGPIGVAVDSSGIIYIADNNNHRIRKVDTGGTITTIAGDGRPTYSGENGLATSASLYFPSGVAVDSSGNIYIADKNNNRIRKVDTSGTITTVAGNGALGYSGDNGPATSAHFSYPRGVAVDSSGNIYIADTNSHRVRKVNSGGIITTVAGDRWSGYAGDNGPATSASLWYPTGVAVDPSGKIYIADEHNNRIRMVDTYGTITTVAGNGTYGYSGDNGPATSASLTYPTDVAVDSAGGIYIADLLNHRIRKVSVSVVTCAELPDGTPCYDGNVCTTGDVCSGGVCAGTAMICNDNNACTIDSCNTATGCIYSPVVCQDNNACTIDSCNTATGACVNTAIVCNDNNACTADTCDTATGCVQTPVVVCNDNNACTTDTCNTVTGICVFKPQDCNDYDPCTADSCDPIRGCVHTKIPDCNAVWTITTVAGNGTYGYSGDNGPAISASLNWPAGVAVDSSGNIYIADEDNNRIRMVDTYGTITTVAGNGTYGYSGDNGPATSAAFRDPGGVAVDPSGNIYIADMRNDRIRKVDTSGFITTVAGNGTYGYAGDNGPATSAAFRDPGGVAVDPSGSIYIADHYNNRIRKVDASGTITTVAGNGTEGYSGDNGPATSASLEPFGVAVDSSGNIYIADAYNNCIRKVDTSGFITTVAGNGTSGYSGDNGPATSASLLYPGGVAVDLSGSIYIADEDNNRIRMVDTYGTITTVAGNGTSGYSGDNGPATSASLKYPTGVAVDSSGNIYIADRWNHRIRKVTVSIVTCAELPDGTPCYDGNACTAGDACSGGACAGTVISTDDGNVCTDDSCVNGVISHTPNTAACNDNNACTVNDSCSGGICAGTAVQCDDNNTCTTDTCIAGVCQNAALPDGTTCTTGAQSGTCQAAVCVPYPACPKGAVKTVTLKGGKDGKADNQIMTEFTVMNGGCIVRSSQSKVVVTPGTVLLFNCKKGIGPQPTEGTWKDAPLSPDNNQIIQCPAETGDAGHLILNNYSAPGGKDGDDMVVNVSAN